MLVLPSLHPSAIMRVSEDSAGGMGVYKETVIRDLKRALTLRHRKPNWDESVIWEKDSTGRLKNLFPTVQEVWEFCSTARGQFVANDVETSGDHPMSSALLCNGFAREDGRAICIPWLKQGGIPYWTEGDQRRVWEILSWFYAGGFGGANAPKIGYHNGSFDSVVLWTMGWNVFPTYKFDTIQAAHVLDCEVPMGLDYWASRYTEIVYYKDAVKGDVRWLDMDDVTLRSYNLRDCKTCVEIAPKIEWELLAAGENQIALYQEEIQLAQEMARATIRGIYVDQWRKYCLSKKMEKQTEESLGILKQIAGDQVFNPNSYDHLQWVLFKKLGFPVVKETTKGRPSTDKEAMVLLALHAKSTEQTQFLQSLVTYRKNSKLLSTFVGTWDGPEWQGGQWINTGQKNKNGEPILDWQATLPQPSGQWVKGLPVLFDGRVHPQWKLLTKTGRMSSSPPAQNWNAAIKKIFCAGPGRKLVGADLSQAELRGMAYAANDQDLLYCYENGIDVHTFTASLLFQIRNPGKNTNPATEAFISEAMPRMLGMKYEDFPITPEERWKGQRDLAKNGRFSWQYGAEADTIYSTLRSKRDGETDKLLFPNIQFDQVQAVKVLLEQTNIAIPKFWKDIQKEIQLRGFHECSVSGRRRYFKGGFKRNEMLNIRIQTLVSSVMNKALLRIAKRLNASAGINLQVHDMLGAECNENETQDVKIIFREELSKTFSLPGFPNAKLPPDEPSVGFYVNEI